MKVTILKLKNSKGQDVLNVPVDFVGGRVQFGPFGGPGIKLIHPQEVAEVVFETIDLDAQQKP